jgi:4-amino-4-deoxy-L-arabinose transferase-like glycosyltransferase
MKPAALLAAVLLVIGIAHALVWQPSEPFFNNDETRHVMTGVFVRDLLVDLPLDRPRAYAVERFVQYPALGLIVWPPLFYGVEGLFMLVFGTSFLVAKAAVWLFAAVACTFLFLLVRRTHGTFAAAVAVLLFGLSPLVFRLSQQVMLEIPALAFALAAVYGFAVYLELGRRRDLALAAAAAACCALTRYDVPVLIAFFLLAVLGLRRLDVLRRREVWLAAALALAVVLPAYLPMMAELGRTHLQVTVQRGGDPAHGHGFFAALSFYPRSLARALGWAVLAPALVGLLAALMPERRRACWPYLALAAATYLTFTPLAERQARHAVYWLPAFALFAVEGIAWIAGRLPRLPWARAALASAVAAGAFLGVVAIPALYVRGYEEAARYVVANTGSSRFTFVDGFLNGDFIYQVRRHDPGRRLWVLRGDKLLYGVLNDPRGGYEEHAGGESGVLATLYRYDPELIVVEEPQVAFEMPMAALLRRTLAAHPERFAKVKSISIASNVPVFQGVRLDVYRSLLRNPDPARRVSFGMMGLGRPLAADLAPPP